MIDFHDKSWINYIDEQVWNNIPNGLLKSRNSSEATFRCPICGDSKKSKLKKRGYFYRKTGTYHCFNCDANLTGLGLLKFLCTQETYDRIIQDYKVLNFNSIVRGKRHSNNLDGNTNPNSFEILSPNPSYKYLIDAHWNEPTPLSDSARAYLDKRMIPDECRTMLSSITDSKGNEFILIKYIYDDSVIYHQLDNFNRYDISGQGAIKYVFPKDDNINGQSKPIFNIDEIDPSFPYIFCTEGIYDSLFIRNGVALGGRNLTDYQWKMLKECYPRHKIVMAFDNDSAGMESSLKHADKYDVSFLNIYELLDAVGTKDINDFVKATHRLDIFSDAKTLKKLTISRFFLKMKLKLKT